MKPDTTPTHCLACGSPQTVFWATATDLEYFTTDDTFSYWKCDRCASLSITPIPEDRLSVIYPSHYYSFSTNESLLQRIKQKLDRRHFRKLLARVPGKSLSVLDVGGGSGWMLDMLRAADARVTHTQIVDIDPGAMQLAKSKGHSYFCGKIEDFESNDKFHFILLLNLIEHVKDPGALIAKASQLLAPGGVILIKTPNIDCAESRIFRHSNWGAYHCPRHWVLFNPRSVRELLEKHRLNVDSVNLTQGATFWAGTLLMMLFRRGWIRVDAERTVEKHPLYSWLCALFAIVDSLRKGWSRTSQMFITASHQQPSGRFSYN